MTSPHSELNALHRIDFILNGDPVAVTVEARRTLLDCLRDDLQAYGTHVGCEHGVCGCCNVIVDGDLVRSCLMFAWQAAGSEVVTIEGIESPDGLSDVQEAFVAKHAMQCGYCTPGMVMTVEHLIGENPTPSRDELIEAVSGNLCRCTGYQQILEAAEAAIEARQRDG